MTTTTDQLTTDLRAALRPLAVLLDDDLLMATAREGGKGADVLCNVADAFRGIGADAIAGVYNDPTVQLDFSPLLDDDDDDGDAKQPKADRSNCYYRPQQLDARQAGEIKWLAMFTRLSQKVIGQLYDVSPRTVSHIKCGRRWKGVRMRPVPSAGLLGID